MQKQLPTLYYGHVGMLEALESQVVRVSTTADKFDVFQVDDADYRILSKAMAGDGLVYRIYETESDAVVDFMRPGSALDGPPIVKQHHVDGEFLLR